MIDATGSERAVKGKRKAIPGRQTYVPFDETDQVRIQTYLDREGRKKGWLIRTAVREFLDRAEKHPSLRVMK